MGRCVNDEHPDIAMTEEVRTAWQNSCGCGPVPAPPTRSSSHWKDFRVVKDRFGQQKARGSMTVTVSGFMRPLQDDGRASVWCLVVVDAEEILKQMVLTNAPPLENGWIVQHGRHYHFAVRYWRAHTSQGRPSRCADIGHVEDRRCREDRRQERHILDEYRGRPSSTGNELPARDVWRTSA
jgi:hypothetical protein